MVEWATFEQFIGLPQNEPITSFAGEYDFLSNFYPAQVTFEQDVYPTVEHAYQAAKTNDPLERIAIRQASTPGQAKRLGKTVTMIQNWDNIKAHVMEDLLRQKFSDPFLMRKLIETRKRELIEGNTWGDTYWGVCKGVGENMLGKLLMQIRKEIT